MLFVVTLLFIGGYTLVYSGLSKSKVYYLHPWQPLIDGLKTSQAKPSTGNNDPLHPLPPVV